MITVVLGVDDPGPARIGPMEDYLRERLIADGLLQELDRVTVTISPGPMQVSMGGARDGLQHEEISKVAREAARAYIDKAAEIKERKGRKP